MYGALPSLGLEIFGMAVKPVQDIRADGKPGNRPHHIAAAPRIASSAANAQHVRDQRQAAEYQHEDTRPASQVPQAIGDDQADDNDESRDAESNDAGGNCEDEDAT